MRRFEHDAKKFSLLINKAETKYMEMRTDETQEYLIIQTQNRECNFEKVEEFQYSEVNIINQSQEEHEISKKMLKGSKVTESLINAK